jgi:hypothetical protein
MAEDKIKVPENLEVNDALQELQKLANNLIYQIRGTSELDRSMLREIKNVDNYIGSLYRDHKSMLFNKFKDKIDITRRDDQISSHFVVMDIKVWKQLIDKIQVLSRYAIRHDKGYNEERR